MRFSTLKATTVMTIVLLACSGSGTGSSGGSVGSSGSGAGTFSCTQKGSICTQLLVPSSEVSAETSTCETVTMGTPGTGCATTGVVGCCKGLGGPSHQEQCYYSSSAASVGESTCKSLKGTWSKTL